MLYVSYWSYSGSLVHVTASLVVTSGLSGDRLCSTDAGVSSNPENGIP